jgi:tetratricopeptide (TPR) repeat protein
MTWLRFGLAVLLILAIIAVFGDSVHFDFVHYDDHRYVLRNRFLADGLSLDFLRFSLSFDPVAIYQGVSNWHPLTWLSYGLDVTLFGVDPGAMHAVNIGYHTINSLLVYALFDRTTRAPVASACIAALFAIHPLHVEAVVWIAERKELVAAFFGLLACHAWIDYATRGGRLRYSGVLFLAALSLLAKPMWVTLPFLLLALDHWPLGRGAEGPRRLLVEKLPFFVLSLLSSIVTLYAQQNAAVIAGTVPLTGRILNAIAAPIDYLRLTAWPMDLSVIYPHPYLPGGTPPTAIEWFGVAVGWLGIATITWWARNRGYVVFGLAWFLISLVPVIGIIQMGEQAIADRYTYVSLIGIFALVTLGLRDVLENRGVSFRVVSASLVAAGFLGLGLRCAEQVGAWRDSITLFEHSVRATPDSATVRFKLGNRLLEAGREEDSIAQLEAARTLRPNWVAPTTNLAWLLATTDDARLADPTRAVALSLEVTHDEGNDANALDTLAAAYAAAGNFARAETVARRAVAIARAEEKRGSARIYEERRRLYAAGKRYVEPIRPEESGAP